jgi:hypothetical protein
MLIIRPRRHLRLSHEFGVSVPEETGARLTADLSLL